ncbi:MAG TPA: universal stress protein [Solirubrobacterales bacterium]|jgi:nucleotide-binding universal stress UspA family protein
MLAKVMVGYDGRTEARDALALGRMLARLAGGRLILAAVLPVKKESIGLEGYEAALEEDSDRLFAAVLPSLSELDVETCVTGNDPPAEALRTLAENQGADAIVLGSTHRGPVGRIYPGSVAERLLHGSPCGVAVAPRGFASRNDGEPRVLAVAFDGSLESELGLEVARGLAEASSATVRVVAVHEPFAPPAAGLAPMGVADVGAVTQREAMEERLHEAVDALPAAVRAKGLLRKGRAAEELLKEAELGVDLLVMGSRGHGPLGQVLLGGVSAKVVRSAPCPVLVMPRSATWSSRPVTAAGDTD